jgi:CDP-diacylglycerol--glycerol-3-phosphate 3-phosphatidyltransferase
MEIKLQKDIVLSDWVRQRVQWIIDPICRFMARLGISPNGLTLFGFVLNVVVAAVLATGRLRLGGWLLMIASAFDGLDGSLARQTGRSTRFGAFLDSVLDRFSESAILLGLSLYALTARKDTALILAYVTIVGSLLVSYTRARAEGLDVSCKVGLGTRFERMAVLVLGLLLGQVGLVLWILAILANVTALHRIYYVWRATRGGSDAWPG